MDLDKLKPIVGNQHWYLFEQYLGERRQDFIKRLISEEDTKAAAVLRGRLKELDILLDLPTKVLRRK
jgi:hypothetical protein